MKLMWCGVQTLLPAIHFKMQLVGEKSMPAALQQVPLMTRACTWQHNTMKTSNGAARVRMFDSAAFVSSVGDFVNMTWGTLSPTHFLSHDIIGWYWQAPTSCVMLWDFTGNQRRLNTRAGVDGGPIHLRLKAAACSPRTSRWDKQLWNFTTDVRLSCGLLRPAVSDSAVGITVSACFSKKKK